MELLRVDILIVFLLLALTLACFLKFSFDMDKPVKRLKAIVYCGIGIILLAIDVRVACHRLILAAGFKAELAIWIALSIGILTILSGVICTVVQMMNIKFIKSICNLK